MSVCLRRCVRWSVASRITVSRIGNPSRSASTIVWPRFLPDIGSAVASGSNASSSGAPPLMRSATELPVGDTVRHRSQDCVIDKPVRSDTHRCSVSCPITSGSYRIAREIRVEIQRHPIRFNTNPRNKGHKTIGDQSEDRNCELTRIAPTNRTNGKEESNRAES